MSELYSNNQRQSADIFILFFSVEVHLRENMPNFDFLAENVVCKQDIIDGLMAQSVLVPGLSTILVLLSTSVSDETIQELSKVARSSHMPWLTEYLDSLGQEFYTSAFHASFIGFKFIEAVQVVYRHLGVQIVGYGIDLESNIRRYNIQMSCDPEYILTGKEVCIVVASDVYNADRISQFDASAYPAAKYYTDNTPRCQFIPADLHHSNGSYKTRKPASIRDENSSYEEQGRDTVSVVMDKVPDNSLSPIGYISDPLGAGSSSTIIESTSYIKNSLVIPTGERAAISGNTNVGGTQNPVTLPAIKRSNSPIPFRRRQKLPQEQVFNPQDLRDHFIICDCSDETTRTFDILISSIRHSADETLRDRPIVVLTKSPPKIDIEGDKTIKGDASDDGQEMYRDVYFIAGNPTDINDLEEVGAIHAARCLVLSDIRHAKAPYSTGMTADARGLLTALNFESMNEHAASLMVIECLREDTIKLIGQTQSIECSDERLRQFLRPSFMSGNVSVNSILCGRKLLT